MRIRLRIVEKEDRHLTNTPDSDLLFQRALIPKYSPVSQHLFPVALSCVCALLYFHGGRELWQRYRLRFDDPLSAESRRDAGRLSLSFLGSIALHAIGMVLLIPIVDLLASMQPEAARLRAPLIQPILVKGPSNLLRAPHEGDIRTKPNRQGRGLRSRPNAGSDSSVIIAKRGAEPSKPTLRADDAPRDTGHRRSTVIADLQITTPQPEQPPAVLWTENSRRQQAPESVLPAAAKPPSTPDLVAEQMLSMQPKHLEIDPKLTLPLASLQETTTTERKTEKADARDADDTDRRDIEYRVSVGTGEDGSDGVRLVTAVRKSSLQRAVEVLPVGKIHSPSNDDLRTGGTTHSLGDLPLSSQDGNPTPGRVGGSGAGKGAFGLGAGTGVGRGSSGEDDAAAKPNIQDLLAALELADPERGRTIVHPEDGAFDLVVTQSSLSDIVVGADGILKGNQVETVYLSVGTPKEWILQYSEPDERRTKQEEGSDSGVYFLEETPSPISSPYPSVTVRPPAPLMPKTAYLLIHGFITADGVFDKLKIVGARFRNLMPMLKPSLQKWRFRPATRDGEPMTVEILLLIPPVTI